MQQWLESIPEPKQAGVFDIIEQGHRNDTIPGTLISKGEIRDIVNEVNLNTSAIIKKSPALHGDNYSALQDLVIESLEKGGPVY